MNLLNRNSAITDPSHQKVFEEGADEIAYDEQRFIGLWHTSTPSYNNDKTGTIGACCLDETPASAQLLQDAATYLHRKHDCQTVIGPMNGNTWMKHRLVTESTGRDPFLMEPVEPRYLEATFKAALFEPLSCYSSSVIDLEQKLPDYSRLGKRLATKGYRIRNICLDHFDKDLQAIYQLSIDAFGDNFLYTPIEESEFMSAYHSTKDIVDSNFVLLAEQEGTVAGFLFGIPDAIATGKPALIIKTLATSSKHRAAGLGTWLVAEVQQRAKERGYTEAIHALQFESNSSLRISKRFNASVFRRIL